MLWLTLPVLFEQVLHLAVQYVDFFLTGRFLPGESFLAAMMLMMYAAWFIVNLFSVVAIGATALTARMVGAGNREEANRTMHQSLVTGIIWSLLLMAVGFPLVRPIVAGMAYQGEAATAAVMYLRFELAVLPAIMVERVGVACLRGAGDTLSGLIVMSIVNVINAVISFVLVTGVGPFPQLGWQGLLIGTVIGHLCGAVLILVLLWRGRAGYCLRLTAMRPDIDLIRRLLRIGIPGGMDALGLVACHLLFVRSITQLGEMAAAAHGVAVQIEALAFMPGAAFEIVAATLAGQYLGANDHARARRSVLLACLTAGSLMVAAGIIFFLAATPLVTFFLGDRPTGMIALSARLLRVVAFTMPPLAISMVLTGALRGAGDTRWPLLFTFIGFLGIRIPLAYFLAHTSVHIPGFAEPIAGMGLGVLGAWYAMVVDVFARCTMVSLRFWHGGWSQIDV